MGAYLQYEVMSVALEDKVWPSAIVPRYPMELNEGSVEYRSSPCISIEAVPDVDKVFISPEVEMGNRMITSLISLVGRTKRSDSSLNDGVLKGSISEACTKEYDKRHWR